MKKQTLYLVAGLGALYMLSSSGGGLARATPKKKPAPKKKAAPTATAQQTAAAKAKRRSL